MEFPENELREGRVEITMRKYDKIVKHVQSKKISDSFFSYDTIIKSRFTDFSSKTPIRI
jgi:hypothetical protein